MFYPETPELESTLSELVNPPLKVGPTHSFQNAAPKAPVPAETDVPLNTPNVFTENTLTPLGGELSVALQPA